MTTPAPKKASKAEVLAEVSRRTGLSRATCKELLKAGWTYREGANSPSAFVSPLYRLKQ